MLAGDAVEGETDPEAHEVAVVVDFAVNAAVVVVKKNVLRCDYVVAVIVAAVVVDCVVG